MIFSIQLLLWKNVGDHRPHTLNMRYVRFHAILHDEVGLYDETDSGTPTYNFTYVDQIYDGLLERGVRPFVEISFMSPSASSGCAPYRTATLLFDSGA